MLTYFLKKQVYPRKAHLIMDTTYCSVTKALTRVHIGRSYLYLRLADGSIRSRKAGKKRLIEVASLDAWAASLPEVPLQQTAMAKEA
jgi:hypothetical protein